uniref:Ras GTPase-activating protein-binding protein 2-like n=1 Tax=Nelumbo nucifera TaxID=4432 RepID=A0A822YRB2_NELNU|nr:TPA_asm: hypothetical protein HUJ06_005697 [Nelumbo nucifera]
MAMQTASPAHAPSAQVVGNAFVEQYYLILHHSPELVYRFYQDSSVFSRPEPNGTMSSVTTMQAINDKVLSLDYKDYKAEIETVDAQDSYKDGVIVLVTGCLTGKDNVRKKFTQLFFLAPQEKGYFVLNDVFRFVDQNEAQAINPVSVNDVGVGASASSLTQEPEPTHVPDRPVLYPTTSHTEEDLNNGKEVCNSSGNEEGSDVEVEIMVEAPEHSSQNEAGPPPESIPTVPEDAPKKSYASIVKFTKGSTASTTMVYVATNSVREAPANTDQQSYGSAAPALDPEASAPSVNVASDSSNAPEEVEGHSIYIRSLPLNAMPEQLEEVFKKFGPIKPNGIQVRSNKNQGFCFGFVEFELLSSMQSAIEFKAGWTGSKNSSRSFSQ